jgi:hypothetical protein
VTEAQGGVAGDRPLAPDDLADAVRRNSELAGQLGRRDADFLELVGKDFAGVDKRPARAGTWFNGKDTLSLRAKREAVRTITTFDGELI